uniref:Proteasome alpha-type subunits domain-containing protein n=1 Tax=Leptocylindrus danicus TaxID=163516 RepID=A0A7S2PI33_9STRA|mmetsp:Transcript_33079/g.47848  ORF Transcript_33079/g.47848 Transcript_33079/m.47848 type:complete len:332 (+) Transcript_33079:249-1244(+)
MKQFDFLQTILVLLLFATTAIQPAHSAHSARKRPPSRKINTAKYDRSISIFNEDGQLLQVDYAIHGTTLRGQPILCMSYNNTAVLCIVNSSNKASEGQMQMVAEKVHRVDEGILLVTTGLAGDGRALAQSTRMTCQRLRMDHGEPPTVYEVAREVANIQHELTRTAGARPIGCTATVVGLNAVAGQQRNDNAMQLFQSEPGGVLEEYNFCAAGKQRREFEEKLDDLWGKVAFTTTSRTSGEHEDGQVNDESNVTTILEEMARGMVKIILDDPNYANDVNDGDGNNALNCKMDLWVLQPDSTRRGGVKIKCARGVASVDDVEKLLFASSSSI